MTETYIDRWGNPLKPDESPTRHDRTGAFGILQHQEKVLMMHPGYLPEESDLPGGGMDPGESLEEALIREVQEETGFTIDNVPDSYIFTHKMHFITDCRTQLWDYTQYFYHIDVSHRDELMFEGKKPVETGEQDAGYIVWVPIEDLPSSNLRVDHRPALEHLFGITFA